MDQVLYQTEMEFTHDKYLDISKECGDINAGNIMYRLILIIPIMISMLLAIVSKIIDHYTDFFVLMNIDFDNIIRTWIVCNILVGLYYFFGTTKVYKKMLLANAQKHFESIKYMKDKSFVRVEFYGEHMVQYNDLGTIDITYQELYRAYESKSYFYLLISLDEMITVEKAQCSDEFIQFIRETVMKKIA